MLLIFRRIAIFNQRRRKLTIHLPPFRRRQRHPSCATVFQLPQGRPLNVNHEAACFIGKIGEGEWEKVPTA